MIRLPGFGDIGNTRAYHASIRIRTHVLLIRLRNATIVKQFARFTLTILHAVTAIVQRVLLQ